MIVELRKMKTLWGKKSPYSHNIFKRRPLRRRQKASLIGKVLNNAKPEWQQEPKSTEAAYYLSQLYSVCIDKTIPRIPLDLLYKVIQGTTCIIMINPVLHTSNLQRTPLKT